MQLFTEKSLSDSFANACHFHNDILLQQIAQHLHGIFHCEIFEKMHANFKEYFLILQNGAVISVNN